MKLNEILVQPEQLDEVSLRKAAAIGAIAAASMMPHHIGKGNVDHSKTPIVQKAQPPKLSEPEKLVRAVVKNWDVTENEAAKIVKLAFKYEKPVFPKAKDILAVIGVESEFDKDAVSQLHKDPAIGLMQVRPGVWGLKPADLSSIDKQIEKGTGILSDYYDKIKDPEDSLHAYNVGYTQFRKGKRDPHYVDKYKKAIAKLNV